MARRIESTIWKSSDNREIASLSGGVVWTRTESFNRQQIDDIIEALEDARDMMDAEKAKAETREILAGSVC